MWGCVPLLLRTGCPLTLWLISQHCWGCLCLPTLFLEWSNWICCAITVSSPHITCMTPQPFGTTLHHFCVFQHQPFPYWFKYRIMDTRGWGGSMSPNTGNGAGVCVKLKPEKRSTCKYSVCLFASHGASVQLSCGLVIFSHLPLLSGLMLSPSLKIFEKQFVLSDSFKEHFCCVRLWLRKPSVQIEGLKVLSFFHSCSSFQI